MFTQVHYNPQKQLNSTVNGSQKTFKNFIDSLVTNTGALLTFNFCQKAKIKEKNHKKK